MPLALTRLRATPRGPSGLSPFELLYGRPFLISHNLPAVPPPLLSYLPYLTLLRALLRAHADAVIPAPNDHDHKEAPPQGLFPGDQVLLRNLHPGSLQTRWTGLHTVIFTTPTAAKLLGHQAWVHINKRAPAGNDWTSQMVGPTKLRLYGLLSLVLLSPLTQATECECMRGSGHTRYFQSFTHMPSKCYAGKSPYTCTSVHAPGRTFWMSDLTERYSYPCDTYPKTGKVCWTYLAQIGLSDGGEVQDKAGRNQTQQIVRRLHEQLQAQAYPTYKGINLDSIQKVPTTEQVTVALLNSSYNLWQDVSQDRDCWICFPFSPP